MGKAWEGRNSLSKRKTIAFNNVFKVVKFVELEEAVGRRSKETGAVASENMGGLLRKTLHQYAIRS